MKTCRSCFHCGFSLEWYQNVNTVTSVNISTGMFMDFIMHLPLAPDCCTTVSATSLGFQLVLFFSVLVLRRRACDGEQAKTNRNNPPCHLNHDGATRSGDLWTVDLEDRSVGIGWSGESDVLYIVGQSHSNKSGLCSH